jgi:hypothetical protein
MLGAAKFDIFTTTTTVLVDFGTMIGMEMIYQESYIFAFCSQQHMTGCFIVLVQTNQCIVADSKHDLSVVC